MRGPTEAPRNPFQVHARAFKILTKLAGTVMDDEMLLYRLYLEYDAARSGALGLTEISKWVEALAYHTCQPFLNEPY